VIANDKITNFWQEHLAYRSKIVNPMLYFVERFGSLPALAIPVEIAPPLLRVQPVSPVRLRCGIDAYLVVRRFDVSRLAKTRNTNSNLLSALSEHMLFLVPLDEVPCARKAFPNAYVFPFVQHESFWRKLCFKEKPKIGMIYLPINHLPLEKQLSIIVCACLDHLSAFYYELQSGKRTWFSEAVAFFDDPIMFKPFRFKGLRLLFVTEPVFALGLELEVPEELKELAKPYLLGKRPCEEFYYYSGKVMGAFIRMLSKQVDAQELLKHFCDRIASHLAKVSHNINLDEVYLPVTEMLKLASGD